ncbi:aromatic ring-hydroxylating dioxygenase subunit alpha [Rhodobacter sp. 24-YEA-8]|uniref:aromatic ring-hydroxylating oxygenase subunit alpha n=1 Tax=Rhodobacter sp. 24-YEA-8 TaxID=1884310 RepID=UPI0008999AA4|nr:SRPBCC family protein [Rhodobacter sp. 24-YEA-8]SED62949.1 Phenylpropionate dioxygenase, large terminal subunit [Rhodobacter sp. 24-YEA-8]
MTKFERIDALGELRANVAVPFNQARAMPRNVYTSQEFLEVEIDKIFSKEWLCAGRASSLSKPGDYLTMEIAGYPIVVLRDAEKNLRAMSNVCLHRMSTLLQGSGNTRAIVCPYHAWTYNLDGTMRAAPGMTLNEAFCKHDYKLPAFRCEEWLGWIMVSIDKDVPPASEKLADLGRLVGHYGMENYVESFRETLRWNTNWKVLAENFMESYHVPVCHRNTIGSQVDLAEVECPSGTPTFNYHCALKSDEQYLALAHPNNTRLTGEERRKTYIITVYPGLFISLSPGYFWYLSLYPRAPGEVEVTYGGGLAPEFLEDPDSEKHFAALKVLIDDVNAEDKGCTEKVYRGLVGGLTQPGHLSHLERPNFEFANYILSKCDA